MAFKTFNLEIITPQRVVFKGEITECSVPGTSGGFQILYNHAPLLSTVEIGEVKITEGGG